MQPNSGYQSLGCGTQGSPSAAHVNSEPEENGVSKHGASNYICAFIMSIFFAGMAIFVYVVTHNPHLEKDEYKVSIWYIIQSSVFYFLCSLCYTGRRSFWLWRRLLNWRISGLIGACWAINYVCILVAGPYLPNAIQTIFSQGQLVIVYMVNYLVFKNKLSWYHHAIIGSIITFNLATAWSGGFSSSQSGIILVVWCVIFMVNSLAAGLANNLLEALFECLEDSDPLIPSSNGVKKEVTLIGGYNIKDYIFAINAVAGVWSLIAAIALFFIPLLAYRDNFVHQVFYDWSSFFSVEGQICVLIMGLFSWVYTILSYYLLNKTTALWMTVASQIAVIAQLIILAKVNNPNYQSVPSLSDWINNGIICTVCLVYAFGQPEKNSLKIKESILGRFYKSAVERVFD